jgi:hypothetical protein
LLDTIIEFNDRYKLIKYDRSKYCKNNYIYINVIKMTNNILYTKVNLLSLCNNNTYLTIICSYVQELDIEFCCKNRLRIHLTGC